MKNKYLILIFFPLFFCSKNVFSIEPAIYLNPGVKLGYQFGEGGGAVVGLELSITSLSLGYPIIGLVSNIDYCKGNTKLHFGAEVSAGVLGIDIGPSFYYTDKGTFNALTFGAYSLSYIIPYYETTWIYKDTTTRITQIGSYIKAPLNLSRLVKGKSVF